MKTHGLYNHPLYNIWHRMRSRCYQPSDKKSFHDYGGRGIKICDRWQILENFIADMGPTYFDGASIERNDVNGDYSPENCSWATLKQQARNKRSNVLIEYKGETKPLVQWCEELGLNYFTTHGRISVRKWTVERAFTEPPMDAKTRCAKARAARR